MNVWDSRLFIYYKARFTAREYNKLKVQVGFCFRVKSEMVYLSIKNKQRCITISEDEIVKEKGYKDNIPWQY